MKYASHWALISASLVGIAYACATPEEVNGCQPGTNSSNCDVILANASEFESDASVAQGGSESSSPPGSSGASSSPTPPAGGAAGSSSPPPGGSTGQGGGGGGSGGSGGAAGSSAGTGGAAGSAGSGAAGAAGTTGAGGTTAQSNFNPAACDFNNRAGCEAQACATACPTNQGTYCSTNCPLIITCVSNNTACITEADPMCGGRNNGTAKQCTSQVESSGGTAPMAGTPAFVARALVNCLCDDDRL